MQTAWRVECYRTGTTYEGVLKEIDRKGRTLSSEPFSDLSFKEMAALVSEKGGTPIHFLWGKGKKVSLHQVVLSREEFLKSAQLGEECPTTDREIERHPLRAGYDSLAEIFGEEIYISCDIKKGQWQSPISGGWADCPGVDELTCRWVPFENPRWVVVRTEDLLKLPVKRYFLPREWNPTQPWIDKALLTELYDLYEKEKENV